MKDVEQNAASVPPEEAEDLPHRYTPKPMFQATAVVLIVASLWLASEVWRSPGAINIIMFVGVSIIAVFLAVQALVRVELDAEALTYRMPLRPPQRIKRRAITWVEVGGRRTTALIIGFNAADRERFINLPPLQDQADLLARLGGETKAGREPEHGG